MKDDDDGGLLTALCNVARGAGATGPATLDAVAWLDEQGATADDVRLFGEWWQQFERGKPWPKQVMSFWDDFENKRAPFFAQEKQDGAPAEDEIEARKARIKALMEGG